MMDWLHILSYSLDYFVIVLKFYFILYFISQNLCLYGVYFYDLSYVAVCKQLHLTTTLLSDYYVNMQRRQFAPYLLSCNMKFYLYFGTKNTCVASSIIRRVHEYSL